MKKLLLLFGLCVFIYQSNAQESSKNLMNDTYFAMQQQKHHAYFIVDPLGFITLGPSIQIEPIITPKLSLNTGIRFQNLGLVSVSLFGEMDMSYGLQFGLRYFPKPRNDADRFFIGPGFSYGRDNYKTGRSYNFRAFGGTLGYRWIIKDRFSIEVADLVGLVQSKEVDVGTEWVTDMFVFYMLSVGIGVVF